MKQKRRTLTPAEFLRLLSWFGPVPQFDSFQIPNTPGKRSCMRRTYSESAKEHRSEFVHRWGHGYEATYLLCLACISCKSRRYSCLRMLGSSHMFLRSSKDAPTFGMDPHTGTSWSVGCSNLNHKASCRGSRLFRFRLKPPTNCSSIATREASSHIWGRWSFCISVGRSHL